MATAVVGGSDEANRKPLRRAVGALTLTQMIGWSTTFHIPAVLSDRIAGGTGLSTASVFGGITVMLLVAAAISPAVGCRLDRDGVRIWMVAGSCLTAVALAVMAAAHGPILFGLSWLLLGFAMPIALNQAASTAIVQIAPAAARRSIALLLLLTGLSSTFAWPALLWLDAAFGWRIGLLVCAGLQLLVCAPLHAAGLPRGRPLLPPRDPSARPEPVDPVQPPAPGVYALAAITFSLSGMLTWGLPLHMVGILRDFGHPEAVAVSIGALVGPGQVLARGFEMAGGQRIGILPIGVGAAVLMPVALVALLLAGGSAGGALAFTIGYGLSAGLISIVRAVAPLRLFGAAAYATVLGRLGLPQNVAFGIAPVGFAMLREHWGSPFLVEVALGLALANLIAMTALVRRAPPGR